MLCQHAKSYGLQYIAILCCSTPGVSVLATAHEDKLDPKTAVMMHGPVCLTADGGCLTAPVGKPARSHLKTT